MTQDRPAATSTSRPTFPEVKRRIDEDPARFLCADLDLEPLIRGMDDPDRVQGWIEVAAQLPSEWYDGHAQKEQVVGRLNRRKMQLTGAGVAADGGRNE